MISDSIAIAAIVCVTLIIICWMGNTKRKD